MSDRDTLTAAEQLDDQSYWQALVVHQQQWRYQEKWRDREFFTTRGYWPNESEQLTQLKQDKTMNAHDMMPSKYLKQSDVPAPILVTLGRVEKINLAQEGDTPEHKWALHFAEMDRPMVMNSTNINIVMECLGQETDGWVGNKMVLYVDPNVVYSGKRVGGLRLRLPKQAAPRPTAAPDLDDDIPF